jgi:uncharacterized protein (TIGR00296 family)
MVSDLEGELAVRLARAAIERTLDPASASAGRSSGEPLPRLFRELRGVFVTLKQHPTGELRGCVGFPLPVLALAEAVRDAAVAAAVEDPRFPPVVPEEMPGLSVEVSVLSLPRALPSGPPDARIAAIRPGRDGLIVDGFGRRGLLLPQVAREQGWGAQEFLEGTCQKAGLALDAWRDERVRVRRFEAEVFGEDRPNGPVVRTGAPVTGPDAPDEP